MRSKIVPALAQQSITGEGDCNHEYGTSARMTWARLLKRVFDIDVEQCQCGGKLKLLAVIEEAAAIEKILKPIGRDPQPSSREKARRVERIEAA